MNITMTPIDQIKPYPHNPRKNSDTVEKLVRSIAQFGFNQPIVVDAEGVIVVGHTRYAAARELSMTEVPVIWARELSEAQARAYRIMDNKAHDYTRWDREELKYELDDLEDLTSTGFTLKELDEILYPELGLLGTNNTHQPRHRVIIECDNETDMADVEQQIINKGYSKCRTSWY